MKLVYRAIDQSGGEVADSIEAVSIADANEKLRDRGLYMTSITEDSRASSSPARRPPAKSGRTRRVKNLTLFSRQLAMLVRTGTPLAEALGAIQRQLPPGTWREVLGDLHRQIEEGSTLSAAMEAHPAFFDAVCRSLVAAGEASGKLDAMLERLARLTRQQLRIQRSVTGALTYPCLLLVIGLVVVTVMIAFVMPRFEGLFASLDAPLPPTTMVLMAISDFVRSKWWLLTAVALVMVVGGTLGLSTQAGRRLTDRWVVGLPILGGVARSLMTARFARLLGVLLDSQVPMLEALTLVRNSSGNSLYATLIGEVHDAVVRGESLSSVLGRSPLISPYVSEAIRHGEQSGQVSPVLLDVADFMDEENDGLVRMAAKLLEPIMLIVLGVVVAIIALSIFIPLFDLTSLTHGGGV